MNPFRASHKTQAIRPQNPFLMKQTCGVCLQNTYDYSPFGVSLDGRTVEGDFYRRGFNGMEKDDEFKGKGNSLNFEYRMYDPRVGRFFVIDPLSFKHPYLNPYQFTGNNPIKFIEIEGEDFGIKIDHTNKSIIVVANVYTTSAKAYKQALKSACKWNSKSANVDGYSVAFQIKVIEPNSVFESEVVSSFGSVNFYRKNGKLNDKLYNIYSNLLIHSNTFDLAELDPIGNSYEGNEGLSRSKEVEGEFFVGGKNLDGKYVAMNTHDELGDMGEFEDLVTHEFGHFFGLDDEDGDEDGKTDKYYPGDGGTMEYLGIHLNPISDNDVKTILNYAKDSLGGNKVKNQSNVVLLENIGKSDGSNPIGIKSE